MAAKTENPQSAQPISNNLKPVTDGGKVSNLTDLKGNVL